MATVITGGFGASDGASSGTEFVARLPPPGDDLKDYDNTKPHHQQPASIPQIFRDAMSVRELVFGQQGIPLEAEFDDDDARSWHWVVYASVAATSASPTSDAAPGLPLSNTSTSTNPRVDYRRSSASANATAQRLPVGTIRLIPPPHGPNKYLHGDKHPDADPPAAITESVEKKHPTGTEPYIKLGRLAVLPDYRSIGLAKLLINEALEYAAKHPQNIRPPPSPTKLEIANQLGGASETVAAWQGLAMVHAQVSVVKLWEKLGFTEELRDASGEVEISKEPHWMEEGIEHVGLWKRLKLDTRL
ncbi:uncharacterized protein EI97DRAFT_242476 [Westerdykella ornata]|uniref:N-acetyltransferase domain-containing protein n=1 Tax=Westerdykella ornata TaxID=318751 RepID=A0A6A6J6P4_WESOR|nr:uncharacterized protein EI97DRAFT_242476 [Westerdykella ornata]KAF2271884.1 hypothetical protein EI97DRAFT_242476 [Westerdykella ornata]